MCVRRGSENPLITLQTVDIGGGGLPVKIFGKLNETLLLFPSQDKPCLGLESNESHQFEMHSNAIKIFKFYFQVPTACKNEGVVPKCVY